MRDEFIELAINEAKKVKNDIPVSAVITKGDDIIALCTNKKEEFNDVTAHAEILALRQANKKLNSWRLDECEMFVTLEPCPMCAWAIINARIKNLYFGSFDLKYGAMGSTVNLAKLNNSNINIIGAIKEAECDDILKKYFCNLRNEKTVKYSGKKI